MITTTRERLNLLRETRNTLKRAADAIEKHGHSKRMYRGDFNMTTGERTMCALGAIHYSIDPEVPLMHMPNVNEGNPVFREAEKALAFVLTDNQIHKATQMLHEQSPNAGRIAISDDPMALFYAVSGYNDHPMTSKGDIVGWFARASAYVTKEIDTLEKKNAKE